MQNPHNIDTVIGNLAELRDRWTWGNFLLNFGPKSFQPYHIEPLSDELWQKMEKMGKEIFDEEGLYLRETKALAQFINTLSLTEVQEWKRVIHEHDIHRELEEIKRFMQTLNDKELDEFRRYRRMMTLGKEAKAEATKKD